MVAFVGAADITIGGGLKGFQGLDGQRKGLSASTSAAEATSGEADEWETVASSSEDSSLTKTVADGEVGRRSLNSNFLSGLQPGGRRLLNICRRKYNMRMHSLKVWCGLFFITAVTTQQLSSGHLSKIVLKSHFYNYYKIIITIYYPVMQFGDKLMSIYIEPAF